MGWFFCIVWCYGVIGGDISIGRVWKFNVGWGDYYVDCVFGVGDFVYDWWFIVGDWWCSLELWVGGGGYVYYFVIVVKFFGVVIVIVVVWVFVEIIIGRILFFVC